MGKPVQPAADLGAQFVEFLGVTPVRAQAPHQTGEPEQFGGVSNHRSHPPQEMVAPGFETNPGIAPTRVSCRGQNRRDFSVKKAQCYWPEPLARNAVHWRGINRSGRAYRRR
jgi:hypothetical protein